MSIPWKGFSLTNFTRSHSSSKSKSPKQDQLTSTSRPREQEPLHMRKASSRGTSVSSGMVSQISTLQARTPQQSRNSRRQQQHNQPTQHSQAARRHHVLYAGCIMSKELEWPSTFEANIHLLSFINTFSFSLLSFLWALSSYQTVTILFPVSFHIIT